VQLVLRDARLTGTVALLEGWDGCLDEDKRVGGELWQTLSEHPGLIITTGRHAWQASGVAHRRSLEWYEFAAPSYEQRYKLWDYFLGIPMTQTNIAAKDKNLRSPKSKLQKQGVWNNLADAGQEQHLEAQIVYPIQHLAGQFVLTSAQIRDAVNAARDRASQARRPLTADDLFAMARIYSNPRLSTLARKIEPRYQWADMVLPEDELAKLREVVMTVRRRHKVLEKIEVGRKLAASSGVMALFTGPPGTGKTMAAEVLAAELQLDLYKIELSSVVSKYIGETEKNLERIFSEAANSNAILFFDEADALFGKRAEVKDAHDRYANIEVAYLLQRMELYEGVTILATNLSANLDEAFARRFFRTVEFPFPKQGERLRIWQTIFPKEVERSVQVDFNLLARRFELAGGNIRNIIYSATIQAEADGSVVTMAHLFHGARRELQKMGRLVNEGDFELAPAHGQRSNGKKS
jgi:ATP-dependent Clp protease ATP-binding subunit ClpA